MVLLALHQLAPVELASGEWPVGDFGALGLQFVASQGYGPITSNPKPPSGRDGATRG